jgi:hypothetical protein
LEIDHISGIDGRLCWKLEQLRVFWMTLVLFFLWWDSFTGVWEIWSIRKVRVVFRGN